MKLSPSNFQYSTFFLVKYVKKYGCEHQIILAIMKSVFISSGRIISIAISLKKEKQHNSYVFAILFFRSFLNQIGNLILLCKKIHNT